MNTTRRLLFKAASTAGLIATAIAAGLLKPCRALAEWDSVAFSASSLADALAAIGASGATSSPALELKTPGIVENGAAVPVEVVTTLPDVESIAILAENDLTPLIALFTLADFGGMLSTRIKMREPAIKLHAIVKARGKFYTTAREVKLTVGGYGV
jgi:sulfur-oxidizing protein SoxY